MPLELIVKLTGQPAAPIAPDHRATDGSTYHESARLGAYHVASDRVTFIRVPAVEYVAVRMPFGQPPTDCYIPERLGYRYHCPPAGVAWQHKPLTYPGTAHAPLLATCGPQGGCLLGCLDHDRTVELFASDKGLELRFPKPVGGTVAKIHATRAATLPGPDPDGDMGSLLNGFLAAWGGPSEPSAFLEHRPLIIDLSSQDVPDDQLVTVCNRLIADYAGLADTVILWGGQDDPQRRCCEPIIPLRPVAEEAIRVLRNAHGTVLPYTRPDGADFADWTEQHIHRGCYTYVDHVASCTPQQIANVAWAAPSDSIIEWPTLALPGFGVLASGCIHGGDESQTWPDMTPRPSNPNLSTWPEMGRRLFPRTKFYLGTQNGLDSSWWGLPDGTATGEPKRFAHATERWAFRLGMGLIPRPQPYSDGRKWGLNACTDAIMGEWYRTRFWSRKPKWAGVVDRNSEHFVTAFDMADGNRLHCIDAWDAEKGYDSITIVEAAP